MTTIGSQIRNDADLAHATRTANRFRRERFWRGVGEVIAWVVLFVALGSLARVLMLAEVPPGSGSDTTRALSGPMETQR